MKKLFLNLSIIPILFFVTCISSATPIEKNKVTIKYLKVDAFANLPNKVKKDLIEKNCKIPQSTLSKSNNNIIQGSFSKKGSQDWAVVCSRNGKSSTLIFWEKGQPCPSEIESDVSDNSYVGDLGYERYILPVSKEKILERQKAYGGVLPKDLDHQGVDVGVENASVTYYCENNKWLTLQGSD